MRVGHTVQDTPGTKLTNENMLINDLFREYLAFNNYRSSLSVFQAGAPAKTTAASPGHPPHPQQSPRTPRTPRWLIRCPQLARWARSEICWAGRTCSCVTQRVVSLRCRWVARSWRSNCGFHKITSLLSCTSPAFRCCQSSDVCMSKGARLVASRAEAEEH